MSLGGCYYANHGWAGRQSGNYVLSGLQNLLPFPPPQQDQVSTSQELSVPQISICRVRPKTLLPGSAHNSIDFVVFGSSGRGHYKERRFPFFLIIQEGEIGIFAKAL